MGLPSHVEIIGGKQGAIKGSCMMKGRENTILTNDVCHEITIPSGELSGKRVHAPLTITKVIDRATPLLNQALASAESLSEVIIRSYRFNSQGHEEQYYTVVLEKARITSIVLYMAEEIVAFSYHKITWRWENPPFETSDTWDSSESLGTPLMTSWPEPLKKSQSPKKQAPNLVPVQKGVSKISPSVPKDRFAQCKGVPPVSLGGAKKRLENVRKDIAENGYQPKYSDDELADMAKKGNVGDERFQARFMEKSYLQHKTTPDVPLSGNMGNVMTGASGKGAKYWSTSFDQIEDSDTDPRLISQKLGLDYDSKKEYVLIVADTEKSMPLTGVKSVPATFEKVSEFANTELPLDFPKAFTDAAMTPEFQAEYAKHHAAAVKSKYLKDQWSKDIDSFKEYFKTTDLNEADQDLLTTRMKMHDKIGNNTEYVGNGLTKDLDSNSPNEFGVVETLNFERTEVNLKTLSDNGAILIIKGLKPI
ncbi:MAG: type VI secretion system tube protein Hcp [Proteobacteria bacterium]|nr:type VI secretion system tube protein Hcp [Pseudomonadota bacterium]